MIDLHYAPTPNGWKISIMLEELRAALYGRPDATSVAGDQYQPEFLQLSPNSRMPAIVDHAPADGGAPVSMFETGAILIYLAEKTGRFMPAEMRERSDVMQWLMWQMGGLGPMLGQHGHFAALCAREDSLCDRALYRDEAGAAVRRARRATRGRPALTSPATTRSPTCACFPWTMTHKAQGFTLDDYPERQALVRAGPRAAAGAGGRVGQFVQAAVRRGSAMDMFEQREEDRCSVSMHRRMRRRSDIELVIPGRAYDEEEQ